MTEDHQTTIAFAAGTAFVITLWWGLDKLNEKLSGR